MPQTTDHIYVADVCGAGWWGAFHGIAEAINCNQCRERAIQLVGAMHDVVNWYLGKPIFNAEGFALIAGFYAKALADIEDRADWTLDLDAAGELVAALPVELQGGHRARDIFEQWARG